MNFKSAMQKLYTLLRTLTFQFSGNVRDSWMKPFKHLMRSFIASRMSGRPMRRSASRSFICRLDFVTKCTVRCHLTTPVGPALSGFWGDGSRVVSVCSTVLPLRDLTSRFGGHIGNSFETVDGRFAGT